MEFVDDSNRPKAVRRTYYNSMCVESLVEPNCLVVQQRPGPTGRSVLGRVAHIKHVTDTFLCVNLSDFTTDMSVYTGGGSRLQVGTAREYLRGGTWTVGRNSIGGR